MKLEKPAARPLPSLHGRVRRFEVGDVVTIRHGDWGKTSRVESYAFFPHPASHVHCCGNSTAYTLKGVRDYVYDWQLEKATFIEFILWHLKHLLRSL